MVTHYRRVQYNPQDEPMLLTQVDTTDSYKVAPTTSRDISVEVVTRQYFYRLEQPHACAITSSTRVVLRSPTNLAFAKSCSGPRRRCWACGPLMQRSSAGDRSRLAHVVLPARRSSAWPVAQPIRRITRRVVSQNRFEQCPRRVGRSLHAFNPQLENKKSPRVTQNPKPRADVSVVYLCSTCHSPPPFFHMRSIVWRFL